MKKIALLFTLILTIMINLNSIHGQIVISGFMANPGGTDSPYEYVQLVATQNINFATTPYSVVFNNNNPATANGWVQGLGITYGFNLNSGTVIEGEIFYVGGDGKLINGSGSTDISSQKWIRAINTGTTAGDGFGNLNTTGVLGNGGSNADGIAVFSGLTSSILSTTVPIDAIFYGAGVGTAKPATGGYMMPNNDWYSTSQGTFGNGTNLKLFPDVTVGNVFIKLSGTYNTTSSTWSVARVGLVDTLTTTSTISQIASMIIITGGTGPFIPSVSTTAATNITQTSATTGGNVISDGGATIIKRGVCYGNTANPDTLGATIITTGTTGAFSANLSGLTPLATYYVRAFAVNSVGIAYGNQISFVAKDPTPIPTYTMAQVRGVNALGVADSLNVVCKLAGVVHGLDYGTTNPAFFILDATSGIYVFTNKALGYTVAEGDRVRIIGKIDQFNGLIQIVADSIVKISASNPLNTPTVVTVLNESSESKLIRMNNLTYLSGWPVTAGPTVNAKAKLGSDTITIRIFNSCNLQGTPAPTVPFSIVGLGSQFDLTSPFTSGYQIYPRYKADLMTGIEQLEKPVFNIYPNPNQGKFTINLQKKISGEVKAYSLMGKLVYNNKISELSQEIDLSGCVEGMYFVSITDLKSGNSTTEKIIVK